MRALRQRGLVRLLPARGRYTLLEQHGLDDLLPLAERQGFSLLLGGPFNSGILQPGRRRQRNTTTSPRRRRSLNA